MASAKRKSKSQTAASQQRTGATAKQRHGTPATQRPGGSKAAKPAGPREVLVWVGLGLAGAVGYALLWGYSAFVPVITVPFVVGAAVALCARRASEAAIIGAFAGFAGALLSVWAYPIDSAIAYLNSMPTYANNDIPLSLYQNFIVPLFKANLLNTSLTGGDGAVIAILLAILLTGGVAFGTSAFVAAKPSWGRLDTKRLLGGAAIALVAISFLVTAWRFTPEFRGFLAVEPADKSYSFDPVINLRAYYLMLHGDDYYTAIVRAAQGDARLADGKHFTKEGKFSLGWGSTVPLRQPEIWYFWKFIAPGGGVALLVWAALAAAGFLIAAYLALLPWVSYRALFAMFAVYPALMMGTVWLNILNPDWWATLLIMFSMLLVLRRQFIAAGVVALLAAIFREIFVLWLLALLVIAAVQALRSEKWRKTALVMLVLVLLFVPVYVAHYQKALTYVDTKAPLSAEGGFQRGLNMAIGLIKNPFDWKFLAPTSFLMYPYGSFRFPAWIFLPLGALGFWIALRKDKQVAFTLASYPTFWLVFYFVFGPTNSYWGQHVMPLAVMGTGILLAELHRFVPGAPEQAAASATAA